MSFLRSLFKPSIESEVAKQTAKEKKEQKKEQKHAKENARQEFISNLRAKGKSDDEIRSVLLRINMTKAGYGDPEVEAKTPKSPAEVRLLNEDEVIKNKNPLGF